MISATIRLQGVIEMVDDEEPVEGTEDVMNDLWFKQNYLELIQNYPNRWIAVLDQKVVASGNMKRQVESEAKVIAGDKEFSLYFIEPSDILP
jgi:hypothetical protein